MSLPRGDVAECGAAGGVRTRDLSVAGTTLAAGSSTRAFPRVLLVHRRAQGGGRALSRALRRTNGRIVGPPEGVFALETRPGGFGLDVERGAGLSRASDGIQRAELGARARLALAAVEEASEACAMRLGCKIELFFLFLFVPLHFTVVVVVVVVVVLRRVASREISAQRVVPRLVVPHHRG